MGSARETLDDEIVVFIQSARRGEEHGFTGLYRLLGGRVAGYLRARGVRDADGVTNEVFLGAFRNLATFDGDGARFRSWLFAIAWNKSADWHRSQARQVPTADGEANPQESLVVESSAEHQFFDQAASEDVVALLADLTEDQRNVLMLRIVADLTLEQVAAALDKPIGAVKSLQHRGLAALKKETSPQPVSQTRPTANTEAR